jgi:hypothetical protein
VSLLVWNLTLDLSGLGDPASSYATAGTALEIIGEFKPNRRDKAETPPGGLTKIARMNLGIHFPKSAVSRLVNRFRHCRNSSPGCIKREEKIECMHR